MERPNGVATTHADRPEAGPSASERLLASVVDTVREPLLVLDAGFHVVHTNRAFFRTFGVTPADTIGQSLFTLGEGQWDVPELRALLRDQLSEADELFDVDVDHVFPRIGRRVMLLNARRIVQHGDAPRLTLLAIEDVTEQRRSARRLRAQQRELRRSNAALEEFASVAAHDLQEPLRKILSFGERLDTTAAPPLTGDARQYLDRMLAAAARMRTLIGDLLAYSQAAVAREPFARTDLDVVVHEVVADLEVAIADSGGTVHVGPLPTIEADASQMRQLLQNLISNALKFRRRDAPLVVHVGTPAPAADPCTITVSDNGVGVAPEYRERIFRVFERLHSRSEFPGSGIGLAICRRIVERHGGTITVTDGTESGTAIRVVLPLTQTDAEHDK